MGITDISDTYDVDETFLLEWAERPGAWVRCRSVSTGEMLDVSAIVATLDDRAALLKHTASFLAGVVLEWNFTRAVKGDDGTLTREPVPVTEAGMLSINHKLLLAIYGAYMSETTEVDEKSPLDSGSPSGVSSPGELTGMEQPL